jgi:LL-diaminopimelate aminotransferase
MKAAAISLSSRTKQEDSPIGQLLETKRRLLDEGRDLIDLSLGDPMFSPPKIAVDAMVEALDDPHMSRYGHQKGYAPFREAVARYMARRFGVEVDPEEEVLPTMGAMDGLVHLALTVADPDDLMIIPDPAFHVYRGAQLSASARVHHARLATDSSFLLEFDQLPQDVLDQARLAYLNYPNNPTGAVAPLEYFERAVRVCQEYGIVLASDAAYIEITYDGYRAPSILQVPGARDIAIEFHTLSKTFAMAGWRIGWVVGNRDLIKAFTRFKSFLDGGPFLAVQRAAVAVLDRAEASSRPVVDELGARHAAAVTALEQTRIPFWKTSASPFVWLSIPASECTDRFTTRLLEEAGVAVWGGTAFGQGGEGFIRLALAEPAPQIAEGIERIARYYS